MSPAVGCLIVAMLTFAACSPTDHASSSANSGASAPAAAGKAEKLPTRPPQGAGKPIVLAKGATADAGALVAGASRVTKEWKGQPTWARVAVDKKDLLVYPMVSSNPDVTTLAVPLPVGSYQIDATITYGEKAGFPANLTLAVQGASSKATPLADLLLAPAESRPLQKTFDVTSDGQELVLTTVMDKAAQNNWNANVRLAKMELKRTN